LVVEKKVSYVGLGFLVKFEEKKMAEFGIAFSEAFKIYRASGMDNTTDWFSIGYRKLNGVWGEKKKVRRVAGQKKSEDSEKKDINSVAREVRTAGKMFFETPEGDKFELKALSWMEFNGKKIDHRF